MTRILILTADAGFGHRAAANALATVLRQMPNCAVDVVNPVADAAAPAILRDGQSDYDKIVRAAPRLYQLGYEATDEDVPRLLIEGGATVMLFNMMQRLLAEHKPDVVVTTYMLFQAPLAAVFALQGNAVPLVTVVTDFTSVHRLWFSRVADLICVATEFTRKAAIALNVQSDRVRVTGIPVNPALGEPRASKAALRSELGIECDLPTVLVVGSKRVLRLRDVVRAINHSGHHLQLMLAAGGDQDLLLHWQRTEWHVPAMVLDFVDNMPDLMHAADCVVCKAGGLIVSETLACGLPMILSDVIPGQETGNADYVVEGGAGVIAGDPIDALETLTDWLANDGAGLARATQKARALGKPGAAQAIADLVLQLAQRSSA
jgi:1,2-diacylglycerol 3-beta-galactosyltransferase